MGRPRKQPEVSRPVMLVATESFAGAYPDGRPFTCSAGNTRVMSDDYIATSYPHLFRPIEPHYGTIRTEAATAGPGETR